MRHDLITPPSAEPITLAEAKLHLRVDFDADDALIGSQIAAARLLCEVEIAQSFLPTTWDLHLDDWPGRRGARDPFRRGGSGPASSSTGEAGYRFPRSPLIEVVEVEYRDEIGDLVTLDPAVYRVSPGNHGRIQLAANQCWPCASPEADAVRIRYTAGYADADGVPACIKAAILLTLGMLYEHRGDDDATLPQVVVCLLGAAR